MSFKVLKKLEQIDQQLEAMDSEALLMIGNILSRNNIDLNQLVETLGEIATLSQPLQGTVYHITPDLSGQYIQQT